MDRTATRNASLHPDTLKTVLAFVLAGGKGERLYPLTKDRSKPAVPFGGTYRIIDFTLSNCVNSGLKRICVLTQYKAHSLMRHVKEGWHLFASELGEFIYTIPPQLRVGSTWYLGTADAIYQNVYTLEEERPAHTLILSGDHIYRMDYRDMLAEHLEREADVTIAVLEVPARDASRFGVLELGPNQEVTGFREKPQDLDPEGPGVVANMGVYLFRTDVLVQSVCRDARRDDTHHDFGHDVLPGLVRAGARVHAHVFRGAGSAAMPFWMDIGTLDAYFDASQDLISVSPQFNLYDRSWPIRSAAIQAPPAKFVFAGGEKGRIGEAHDSLVSPGCIVSGGHVERAILGPGCRINSWSVVEDAILMDGVEVGRHAIVRRAIIDKGVRIPPGFQVGVDPDADRRRFTVTERGLVAIPKGENLEGLT
jgi:glucose-1-phosphate adenylyltransferase